MPYELAIVIVSVICGVYLLFGAAIAIRSIMADELWSSPQVHILRASLGDAGTAVVFVIMLVVGIPVYAVFWPLWIGRWNK